MQFLKINVSLNKNSLNINIYKFNLWRYTNKLTLEKVAPLPEPQQASKFAKDSEAINLNQTIKTSDLISWSLQIARGMEFLASKKVTHFYVKYELKFNQTLLLGRFCTAI